MRLTHTTLAAVLLLACTACRTTPTFDSIRFGYSPSRVEARQETPNASDYNNVNSGWASERTGEAKPVLRGFDGTPVGASSPGSVTTTANPINRGVDATGPGGGSRSLLLDLYTDAVTDRENLERANADLQAALEMAETRSMEIGQQLTSLQGEYDSMGAQKERVEQQSFDLAARLATAQIARLEAERALLEATLEWRRMSKANNRPLADSMEARK